MKTEIHRPGDGFMALRAGAEEIGGNFADLHGMGDALVFPLQAEHPNKHPFRGILTRLDEPSTRPPDGSGGRRVILPRATADRTVNTLIGMGVDWDGGRGHDVKAKVGVITAARVLQDGAGLAVEVEGHLYADDFPEAVTAIRAAGPHRMGMSYEMTRVRVEDQHAPVLTITDCVFTGAAILLRDRAAYQMTSLAASTDTQGGNQMEELLKQLVASNTSLTEAVTKQGDTLTKIAAQAERTNELLAKAAEEQQEKPQGDNADGKGGKPDDRGEVKKDEKTEAEMKAQAEELAALKAEVSTLKAASATPPDRKTLTPEITSLLAKAGIGADPASGSMDVTTLDQAIERAGLGMTERLALKSGLMQSGWTGLK